MKVWFMHTMVNDSAMKEGTPPVTAVSIALKILMSGEITQAEKMIILTTLLA